MLDYLTHDAVEKLLHYVWGHRVFPLKSLKTTDGREVEVLDTGTHNHDQGPDFFNAKVRIGDTTWVGNVEIHLHASDWILHGHETDPHYNNTVLHVVQVANIDVCTADGKQVPTLVLPIPPEIVGHYHELCTTEDYPRCHKMIPSLPALKVNGWLDALLCKRLEERAGRVMERVREMAGDWERATFVTLSRNFGFGLNGDAFELWAKRMPLQAAAKHRDNLFQMEAFFVGMGGLLPNVAIVRTEEEVQRLQQEFAYLSHKFGIEQTMTKNDWKFLRTRPQSMPQVRLLQLARLYHEGRTAMSTLLEAKDIEALRRVFDIQGLSRNSADLLIINTVVPLLYAYGMSHQMEALQERAIALLQALPAENNFILRQWKACGLAVSTAADSQALIELKRNYCDRKDCLRCRFAYEYLKMK